MMCFNKWANRRVAAWLFAPMIQTAFAEDIKPNTTVQVLVPMVDPSNPSAITGIAVSTASAPPSLVSSSTENTVDNKEEDVTKVSTLYTTIITTTSTKTGTKMAESALSPGIFVSSTQSSSASPSLPLQSEVAESANTLENTSAPKETSSANDKAVKETSYTSTPESFPTISFDDPVYVPSYEEPGWWVTKLLSHTHTHHHSSSVKPSKMATTADGHASSSSTSSVKVKETKVPHGGAVPEAKDESGGDTDKKMPSLVVVFGAAVVGLVVQGGLAFLAA